jgi:hypothetical protein
VGINLKEFRKFTLLMAHAKLVIDLLREEFNDTIKLCHSSMKLNGNREDD